MIKRFKKEIEDSSGQSELIIALFVDIRGFSEFSTKNESTDVAIFIKRFYSKLITEYFPFARYVKSTGDGLLLIFSYSEKTIMTISEKVISNSFRVINDFPGMFKDDPLVNFETPKNIGIGITRGSACRLASSKKIMDYSGRLLNLAARLMDLARPTGIVLDGNYREEIIPENFRDKFAKGNVYLRGIAEETPIGILYTKDETILHETALSPFKDPSWKEIVQTLRLKDLTKLFGSNFSILIPEKVYHSKNIKVKIAYPNKKLKGYLLSKDCTRFTFHDDASGPHVLLDLSQVKEYLQNEKLLQSDVIKIILHYMPKIVEKK